MWAGSGSLESLVAESRADRETDLAFGKSVIASYTMRHEGLVEAALMNPGGRIVYRRNETKQGGRYELRISDIDVPPGVHVVTIKTPDSRTGRLIHLLRQKVSFPPDLIPPGTTRSPT